MPFGWWLFWMIALGAAVWFANALAMSSMSGWKALAAQFRAAEPAQGEVLRQCVIRLGPGRGALGNMLANRAGAFGVLASAAGLYLDAGSPRSFGWPPLLVPWSNVRLIARRQLFGVESFELRLGRSLSYLTINRRGFATIQPFLESVRA